MNKEILSHPHRTAFQWFLIFSIPSFALVGLGMTIPIVMALVVATVAVLYFDVPQYLRIFVVVVHTPHRMVPA